MPTKEIILHIGSPKTGTTSLQAFCTRNRDILAKLNLLYPKTGCVNVAHHELAWAVNPLGPKINAQPLYDQLASEIENSDCTRILVSSEVFFVASDIVKLRQLLANYKVKVYAYLRRQDQWYQAMYSQYIKENRYRLTDSPSDSDVMEIILKHLDYSSLLDLWAENFDSVAARPYEGGVVGENIISDFFSMVGVLIPDKCRKDESAGEKNISLACDLLELVRLSNYAQYRETSRSLWLYGLQEIQSLRASRGRNKSCLAIDEKTLLNIFNMFRERNKLLNKYRFYMPGESELSEFFTSLGDEQIKNQHDNEERLKSIDLSSLTEIVVDSWVYYEQKICEYESLIQVMRGNSGSSSN